VVVYRVARGVSHLAGEEGDNGGTIGAPPWIALGDQNIEGNLVLERLGLLPFVGFVCSQLFFHSLLRADSIPYI
jgi:hypothetical protein